MKRRLLANHLIRPLVLATMLCSSAAQAAVWAGANVANDSFGVHGGVSLLGLPFVGRVGVEGYYGKGWNDEEPDRMAAGVTWRDITVPLTDLNAFGTLGLEHRDQIGMYVEGGLRGKLLGPAGWRAFLRNGTKGFAAGIGVEARF